MIEYLKVFRAWFKLKVFLWKKDKNSIIFKQGDVWWCSVGISFKIGALDDTDVKKVKKSFLKLYAS